MEKLGDMKVKRVKGGSKRTADGILAEKTEDGEGEEKGEKNKSVNFEIQHEQTKN